VSTSLALRGAHPPLAKPAAAHGIDADTLRALLAGADGVEIPCRNCRKQRRVRARIEPTGDRLSSGSMKIEAECPYCCAYEMVRILRAELETVTGVRVEARR
jgi:hypothetical protein